MNEPLNQRRKKVPTIKRTKTGEMRRNPLLPLNPPGQSREMQQSEKRGTLPVLVRRRKIPRDQNGSHLLARDNEAEDSLRRREGAEGIPRVKRKESPENAARAARIQAILIRRRRG